MSEKLPLRLLLNAEPFGFGPTAAIAGFFPHLRPHFETIGYMGKKHTLDLQRGLDYDAIHDVTGTPKDERPETYAPVFEQYDVLLTAMDHKIAEEAQKAGLKVFYYDALAWYWPDIPDSVQNCDLYLAQNFFGVEDRLAQTFTRHAQAHIVQPIAPVPPQGQDRNHVLINLGGLQNPYWPVEGVVDYARAVIASLRKALPLDTQIVIAGSQAVAKALRNEGVRTIPRHEMEQVLAQSQLAFMTSGLGNIYDAAAFDLPTIWLPPANDSQGQQLVKITDEGMVDAALDWGAPINYFADQPRVLQQIADAATALSADQDAQACLTAQAARHYARLSSQDHSATRGIIDRFGCGGEKDVAHHVVARARMLCQ
jgi:hypothetical protein